MIPFTTFYVLTSENGLSKGGAWTCQLTAAMIVTTSLIILRWSEHAQAKDIIEVIVALSFKGSEHLNRVFGLKLWDDQIIWFGVIALLPEHFCYVDPGELQNSHHTLLVLLGRRLLWVHRHLLPRSLCFGFFKIEFSCAITLSSLRSDDFIQILVASILLVKWIIENFGAHRALLRSELQRTLSPLIINFLKSQLLYNDVISKLGLGQRS